MFKHHIISIVACIFFKGQVQRFSFIHNTHKSICTQKELLFTVTSPYVHTGSEVISYRNSIVRAGRQDLQSLFCANMYFKIQLKQVLAFSSEHLLNLSASWYKFPSSCYHPSTAAQRTIMVWQNTKGEFHSKKKLGNTLLKPDTASFSWALKFLHRMRIVDWNKSLYRQYGHQE